MATRVYGLPYKVVKTPSKTLDAGAHMAGASMGFLAIHMKVRLDKAAWDCGFRVWGSWEQSVYAMFYKKHFFDP